MLAHTIIANKGSCLPGPLKVPLRFPWPCFCHDDSFLYSTIWNSSTVVRRALCHLPWLWALPELLVTGHSWARSIHEFMIEHFKIWHACTLPFRTIVHVMLRASYIVDLTTQLYVIRQPPEAKYRQNFLTLLSRTLQSPKWLSPERRELAFTWKPHHACMCACMHDARMHALISSKQRFIR